MAAHCNTAGCGNPPQKSRAYCGSCRAVAAKERDPERVAYGKLKHRAKVRGHYNPKQPASFLTLEEFRQFCTQHVYLKGRGRTATGYHLDRIDESKGYTLDNLQVLTNSENITKSNNYRAWRRNLTRWLERGGTGPVPKFVPTTVAPTFEYYRGQFIQVYYPGRYADPNAPEAEPLPF